MSYKIRLGTRSSTLAVAQAEIAAQKLSSIDSGTEVEIVPLRTSGDWNPASSREDRLCEAEGGKGMFVREIEQALLDGDIDIAVHSMKDLPSFLPDAVMTGYVLERADARDAFVSFRASSLQELRAAATLGTASMRRQAFALAKRPDIQVVPLRGNVPTRIEKLRAGQVDATFLAVAGLERLNMSDVITHIMEPEEMLPAAGQGAIGFEVPEDRKDLHELLEQASCLNTSICVRAERAALQELDGSCHTPIGAYAEYSGGEMRLRVAVASPEGGRFFPADETVRIADAEEAEAFGRRLACGIKDVLPDGFLDSVIPE